MKISKNMAFNIIMPAIIDFIAGGFNLYLFIFGSHRIINLFASIFCIFVGIGIMWFSLRQEKKRIKRDMLNRLEYSTWKEKLSNMK